MSAGPWITPTAAQLERLAGATVDGPIVMVNLLRVKDREAYGRYAAEVQPLLAAVGARIVATVACAETVIGPEDERWDAVALVEYPSPQAFLEMVGRPEYQRAHVHRDAALADSRLILSTPAGAERG